ncbi:MAG TPA: hypothetical protein VII38_15880 [Polyangia bacterium]|jgi:hypothetical protein
MRRPILTRLDEVDEVRGLLVDGAWIRSHLDVDFTNGGHHFTRRYIPRDEVWVDREAPGAGELEFLFRHQLRERAFMAEGAPYLKALARANRLERQERRAALDEPSLPIGEARQRARRHRVGVLDGDALWVVDGRAVRDRFDPNFTGGGHHWRYRFIPRAEIWIDDAVAERELDFTVAHEAHELKLMRDGMSYHDAHDRALAIERALRRGSYRKIAVVVGAAIALHTRRRRRAI